MCNDREENKRKNPNSTKKLKRAASDSFDHEFEVQVKFLTKKIL
jgi:hypothetical protein